MANQLLRHLSFSNIPLFGCSPSLLLTPQSPTLAGAVATDQLTP